MNRARTIAELERCRAEARGAGPNMDAEDRRHFSILVARETSRAEPRRQPSPQLPLPKVA